jgi:predicted Zn-dependent protease
MATRTEQQSNKQQAKNKIIHATLSMEITIIIQPISFELTVYLLFSLEQRISKNFNVIIKVLPSIKQTLLPPSSFDNKRGQWISDKILNWLLYKNKPDRSTIMLAICDFDAYSNGRVWTGLCLW